MSYRKIRTRQKVTCPLYRYTKKKWAHLFFETGQLRLGTLFDYAKNESYGDAVFDRHEGYCPFNGGTVGPDGRSVILLRFARNNLVLCLSDSHEYSLYEEFDADCCIRITDDRFFKEIDKVLQQEFTSTLLRPVTYLDKTRLDCAPDYVDFAGAIKDKKFRHQKEVRALWEPNKAREENYPAGFKVQIVDNSIINASEEQWFREYTENECNWLSPKTIYAPKAIKYCSLIPVA